MRANRAIPERVAARAATRYRVDEKGCHISTYKSAARGYAQIGWSEGGRSLGTSAHRASWAHTHGPIPDGMTVDHRPTCDRRCVNVEHLRLLTHYENARRNSGKDWPLGQCANGHSNSELIVTSDGRRRCRLCRREELRRSRRAYAARNRERVAQWQREYEQRKRLRANTA